MNICPPRNIDSEICAPHRPILHWCNNPHSASNPTIISWWNGSLHKPKVCPVINKCSSLFSPFSFSPYLFSPLLLALLLFTSLSLPNSALADPAADLTPQAERWRFTSFGTLGFSHALSDEFLRAHQDLTQPETFEGDNSWKLDSLIGAQLSTNLTETLALTVQGVFRERYDQTLERSIERAFIEWQATPQLSFHGGRLRIDFYMLADYRDAGFAYLWIRPPIEFYGAVLVNSVDGLDAVYKYPLEGGVLTMRAVAGQSERDVQTEVNGAINTLEFEDILGVSLSYESDLWRITTGAYRLTFGNDLNLVETLQTALRTPIVQPVWPGAQDYADLVTMQGQDVGFYSAGASYDNLWQLSGEVGYIASDWHALPDTLSAYFSVGRHIGEVTPYILLASVRPLQDSATITAPQNTPSPAANAQLAAIYDGLNSGLHLVRFKQNTISVGARWDVHTNVALKLQWDHSEVGARAAGLWRNESGTTLSPAATVNLVSASANWVF